MTDQGLVYSAFIESELKVERERRANLDARGVALVATSSSLVTLLAAVGAFVIRGDKFVLPGDARFPLLVALVAFAVAAGCGILANRLHKYTVAAVSDLTQMRTSHWKDDAVDSRSAVTYINVKSIGSLRKTNDAKVTWLMLGQLAQLLALVCLAVVVLVVLSSGSPGSSSSPGEPSRPPSIHPSSTDQLGSPVADGGRG